jgi:hypothetical protein
MIRLNFGSNVVVVTLSEKISIASPNYLFEFISNQTQQKYYCIASDTSLYAERYNKFNVVVKSTTPTPLNGEIKIPLGDEYTYNIYEQLSNTNLNPVLSGAIVENGLMTYDKTITSRVEFVSTLTERKAYEPN